MIPDKLKQVHSHLGLLNNLLHKYPQLQIHEKFEVYVGTDKPWVVANIFTDEQLLIDAGEIFGKDKWTCVEDHEYYSWTKLVDGVVVNLNYVSQVPKQQPRPVQVNEWPLQLTNG